MGRGMAATRDIAVSAFILAILVPLASAAPQRRSTADFAVRATIRRVEVCRLEVLNNVDFQTITANDDESFEGFTITVNCPATVIFGRYALLRMGDGLQGRRALLHEDGDILVPYVIQRFDHQEWQWRMWVNEAHVALTPGGFARIRGRILLRPRRASSAATGRTIRHLRAGRYSDTVRCSVQF